MYTLSLVNAVFKTRRLYGRNCLIAYMQSIHSIHVHFMYVQWECFSIGLYSGSSSSGSNAGFGGSGFGDSSGGFGGSGFGSSSSGR